jgi:hypothetical protein
MAIAKFIKTELDKDEYDQILAGLGIEDTPPAGGVYHLAAVGDDGKVKIVELWDSREQAEAWGEKVTAAREAASFGADRAPSTEYLEVHKVIER